MSPFDVPPVPYLLVQDASGQACRFGLAGQGFVFAGAGQSCTIPLRGPEVSQFHCLFYLSEEGVWINDCETGGQTRLNGFPVAAETRLKHGDRLQIGENHLTLVCQEEAPAPEATPGLALPRTRSESSPATSSSPPQLQPVATWDPAEQNPPETYQFVAEETAPTPDWECDSFESEFANQELDLLRSEVEFLRSEVSQRDAELESLRGNDFSAMEAADAPQNRDVERLVQRLEELLEELQAADDRQRHLDEMLRLAEEANLAEKEERRQLERWIDEIEQRVSQREAESAAESERAQARTAEVQEQLRKAESQIRKLIQPPPDNGTTQIPREALLGLRQHLEELQEQLRLAREENDQLRSRPASAPAVPDEIRKLERQVAEVELNAARERAELARQRVELEQLRAEAERKLKEQSSHTESDTRFAIMRQHLRERHAEEKLARRSTLAGRIASLLGRV